VQNNYNIEVYLFTPLKQMVLQVKL
ncbi:uncharacterized protein METZ01_LOCUS153287, partial [marine metagenome]